MLHFTLSTIILINVSILIAMTASMQARMIVTISIAMFGNILTHSNHSLKLEIMVAISWSLVASLLSGVPDYFYRNKISSGSDLSHYSSASLY